MMSLAAATRSARVLSSTQHMCAFLRVCKASTDTVISPLDDDDKEQTFAKPFDSIPGPRGIFDVPIIGFMFHLKPFGKYTPGTINHLFDEMIKKYGPIFKIRTNKPTVVITDPKDLAIMLRNEGKYPYRPDFEILETYYRRTGTKPNVGSMQGADWWNMRAPMQNILLRPGAVSQYLPKMNGVADDFIQMLKSNAMEKLNSQEAFVSYMAESVGIAFFNRRLGFLDKVKSKETKKMERATVDVFKVIQKTIVGSSNGFRYFRSKDYKLLEASMDYLRAASDNFVKLAKEDVTMKKRLGTFNAEEPNMLLALLKDNTEEVAARVVEGLYFASIESSAAGLQVCLYTLAKHQDKQEKLRREIMDVLGDTKQVTQEHLDKMPYLKACVKEVHRCRSISAFGPVRKLPVDVVFGGYNIPAGVQIYNYSGRACFDETIFENPYSYEPERWLRQDKRNEKLNDDQSSGIKNENDSRWAVLPFGIGSRSCPGRRLFEQELYLVLAKLVQHMRIGLKPESVNTEFEYQLFLKSVKPIQFTFTALNG